MRTPLLNRKHFVVLTLLFIEPFAAHAEPREGHGIWPWQRRRQPQPIYVPPPSPTGGIYDNSSDVRPDPLDSIRGHRTDSEWAPVVEGTYASMQKSIDDHFNGLENTGIGTMYGPKSSYAQLTPEAQRDWILQRQFPGTMPPVPKRTSCIDFVLTQLREGYARAGKLERFNEIKAYVVANNGDGLYLLEKLKEDGWTTVYWNPDVQNPSQAIRTNDDAQHNHRPTHHQWTAATVKNSGVYMPGIVNAAGTRFNGVKIDAVATNYRPTNYGQTADYNGLARLENAPLFVGVANGAYHVYLGSKGKVIESHSTRSPHQASNIEVRDFSTWGMKPDEGFGSGVVAIPPGNWDLPRTEDAQRAQPVRR